MATSRFAGSGASRPGPRLRSPTATADDTRMERLWLIHGIGATLCISRTAETSLAACSAAWRPDTAETIGASTKTKRTRRFHCVLAPAIFVGLTGCWLRTSEAIISGHSQHVSRDI